MMTANEARQRSKSKQLEGLDEILKEIERRADLGDFVAYWNVSLSYHVVAKLQELGYKVEESSGRNETLVTISWR